MFILLRKHSFRPILIIDLLESNKICSIFEKLYTKGQQMPSVVYLKGRSSWIAKSCWKEDELFYQNIQDL